MPQEINFSYHPYPWQFDFQKAAANKQNSLAIVGRQQGKTEMALHDLLFRALKGPPGTNYAYVAPFLSQARRVAWRRLKEILAPMLSVCTVRESELSIELPDRKIIYLLGMDNAACRGLSIRGAIVDEFDTCDVQMFREAFLPTQAAHKDRFLIYIGTLKSGESRLYELYEMHHDDPKWHCAIVPASEAGALTEEELREWEVALGHNNFLREFECMPNLGGEHSIIAEQIVEAEKQGRVLEVPISPFCDIHTTWDLGVRDYTSVWLFQLVGREIQVLAYHEFKSIGLQQIIHELKDTYRNVHWGEALLPHDIAQRELISGVSRLETFESLEFGEAIKLPRYDIADSIHATRLNLSRCVFDKNRCKLGLRRLKAVEYEYDTRNDVLRNKIRHDENSHAFDAFRYLGAYIENYYPIASVVDFKRNRGPGSVIKSV